MLFREVAWHAAIIGSNCSVHFNEAAAAVSTCCSEIITLAQQCEAGCSMVL